MDPNSSQPTDQAPVQPQPSEQTAAPQQSYADIISSSLNDLLGKANTNDEMKSKIASEMGVSQESVSAILSGLSSKISGGSITKEELALIMTLPILEEPGA